MKPIPKQVLLALLVVLGAVHGWLAVQWIGKWGFWGAIGHWLASAGLDPIYAAAVLDFITVIALVGLWLISDYRSRLGRVNALFLAWCAFYLVIPSLGLLVYFLWTRPPVADLTSARN